MTQTYTKRTRIEAPAPEVFAWHARPGALERLTPPWGPVEVVDRTGGIEDGARVVLRLPTGPLRLRWLVEHNGFQAGRQFRDVQLKYYSSGMRARLAFSIASCARADVLLLDEIMAVGDAEFRDRCIERLHAFLEERRARD